MCWWMVLLYKISEFRSNLTMSVSSVIKDGKYCKANVIHIKMNSRNISDHMSMSQLYLDSGKATELKARDTIRSIRWSGWNFTFTVWYVSFLIRNKEGSERPRTYSSRDIESGKGMPRRTQHYSNIPSFWRNHSYLGHPWNLELSS